MPTQLVYPRSLCCQHPTPMAIDGRGRILVGEETSLGMLDPMGRMRLIPDSVRAQIVALAPASDGSLWELRTAGESSSEAIRRLAEGGVERFALEGYPGGIAAGPNGSAWVATVGENFGGSNGPEVVELSPGGSTRAFPLPAPVERLGQIVAGFDGDLWVAEEGGTAYPTRIVRLTPTGQVSSWSFGSAGERIQGLAAARAALWFTLGSHRVGRITYTGHTELYSRGIPPDAFPDGITKGSDGAMWFTELGANAVGRVTRSGRITQFSWGRRLHIYGADEGRGCVTCLPGGADSIVTDPEGSLWFARPGEDDIGRLSVSPHCSVPRLLGRRLSRLGTLLKASGCRLGRVRGRVRETVSRQRPAPGLLLPWGTTVAVRTAPARIAARACLPDANQRVVLGDGPAFLLAELQHVQPNSAGVPFHYLTCLRGGIGPQAATGIEEKGEVGGAAFGPTPNLFTLAGHYLAWQETSSAYGELFASIHVAAVRTAAEQRPIALPESGDGARATSIALDGAGHLGWLLDRSLLSSAPSADDEAVQVETAKGVVTLEAGPREGFSSLRIGPVGALHWTREGVEHTYSFGEIAGLRSGGVD